MPVRVRPAPLRHAADLFREAPRLVCESRRVRLPWSAPRPQIKKSGSLGVGHAPLRSCLLAGLAWGRRRFVPGVGEFDSRGQLSKERCPCTGRAFSESDAEVFFLRGVQFSSDHLQGEETGFQPVQPSSTLGGRSAGARTRVRVAGHAIVSSIARVAGTESSERRLQPAGRGCDSLSRLHLFASGPGAEASNLGCGSSILPEETTRLSGWIPARVF